MSDAVWISFAPRHASNLRPLDNDVVERDQGEWSVIFDKVKLGEPLAPNDFPKVLFGARNAEEKDYRLPDLFSANPFWMVSSAAADVLRQFDLGRGRLVAVPVLKRDRRTPVDGEWFCFDCGNQKEALLPEQSLRMRLDYIHQGRKAWFTAAGGKDDEVAVSTAALVGPDVWFDRDVGRAIFFSDRVVKALKKAKAVRGFFLTRCRVLDE